jgi:uncharacterized membrane protein
VSASSAGDPGSASGGVVAETGRAPSRATARALTVGSALSFVAFAVAFVADLADGTAAHVRAPLTLDALVRVDPEAWALVGVLILFATPVAGLLATAVEYYRPERRMSLVALAVLGLLALSVAIALSR